jgi:hypothetical protein
MSGFSKAIDLLIDKVQQMDEKCTMNEALIVNVIKRSFAECVNSTIKTLKTYI